MDDLNLFMVCERVNPSALADMPAGFHVRNIRRDELSLWKRIHFDSAQVADQFDGFMDDFFQRTYAAQEELFYNTCLLVCDESDTPVSTCFAWKQYGKYTTIHWYKVIREYENRGIGRALLSHVMRGLEPEDYPVYLHTQPGSYRAIKLYTDFGFALLDNPILDGRTNELYAAFPYLRAHMPTEVFDALRIVRYDEESKRFIRM